MVGEKTKFTLILMVTLLLTSIVVGCGQSEPTAAPQPGPTDRPTGMTFTSPLSTGIATLAIVVTPPSLGPAPTGTPDADRTPVIIRMAEIGPEREIITIQNISQVDQDISGWALFNPVAKPVFTFPENVVLKPGESVQVYSATTKANVPEGAYFWTEQKVWTEFPGDVLLLNKITRLMYWYVVYDGQ